MATKKKAATKAADQQVVISAPKFERTEFELVGLTPYVQLRFTEKARFAMKENMLAGSQAKKTRKRDARDFEEDFRQSTYTLPSGKYGVPASAFRNGMISACRLVGFKMTLAKLSVFVEADEMDVDATHPMVWINGEPEPLEMVTRNATGTPDIRVRAKFWPWSMNLRVRYDAGLFSASDVANLISRVGMQVGIGEGRPDSKSSGGMGWGTFRLK